MNTHARFRAVLFDVDGTSFDTLPSLPAHLNVALVCVRDVGFSAHLAGYCGQAGELLPKVFSFNNYAEFTRRMVGQNVSTSVVCHA